MSFLVTDLIKKKRRGEALSSEEIQFLITSYTKDEIPDYQMSAWLMAVFFQGMNAEETANLTQQMLQSGHVMDFSDLPRAKVDKHSTGGVGDKTSLILAPIVAATGLYVPMISGRGLGHTGGTLDKLESIPGFNTRQDLKSFRRILEQSNLCFMGQTEEICPADKRLYSLRDVTGTVESLPLICSSIMSKKLAEGIDGLVLDVKCGSGAFMKNMKDAEALAEGLLSIGKQMGKKVTAVITSMEEPLGSYVGNAHEVKECLKILRNEKLEMRMEKTKELSLLLAAHMLVLGQQSKNLEEAMSLCEQTLRSGKAYEKFEEVVHLQGGDLKKLSVSNNRRLVLSKQKGFISSMNTEDVGMAAIMLKAGRLKSQDKIDPRSGIKVLKGLGEAVDKDEPLFEIDGDDSSLALLAEERLQKSYEVSFAASPAPALVLKTLI